MIHESNAVAPHAASNECHPREMYTRNIRFLIVFDHLYDLWKMSHLLQNFVDIHGISFPPLCSPFRRFFVPRYFTFLLCSFIGHNGLSLILITLSNILCSKSRVCRLAGFQQAFIGYLWRVWKFTLIGKRLGSIWRSGRKSDQPPGEPVTLSVCLFIWLLSV